MIKNNKNMNAVKYEEDSNEVEFATNELLSPYEPPPSTSAEAYGLLPNPKLNLLDGTFFSYLPEKSNANKIVAVCMVCRPRHVEVKGYGNCSSNFLSHLKRRHGEETVLDYKNYIRCKKSRYSKNERHEEEAPKTTAIPTGNVKHSDAGMPPSTGNSIPISMKSIKDPLTPIIDYGDQLNENIYKFFLSAMIPPSAVDNPYFSQLLGMHTPMQSFKIMTQHFLEKRMKENFDAFVTNIKSKLTELDYVSTTVHVWTGEKDNFISVVAHWITQDLRRYSAPLACRRIKVKNYDSFHVAQLLREIYEDFGIDEKKLVGTVAGTNSVYVWAFQVYGVQLTNILMSEQVDLEDCILFDCDDMNMYDDIEQRIPPINAVPLDTMTASPLQCCSNLLISAVSMAIHGELNYSNNTPLSNIHATTINKCNILWQAAGNPKLSKIIEHHVNMNLKRPIFSDWTSLNRALQQILAIKDKSNSLHQALNLQNPISDAEFVYLQEYLLSTAPIVEALDILQSNQNTFYGILIPCLFALRRNLFKVSERTQFYYCENLLNSYTAHVTSTFRGFFDLDLELSQKAAFAALSFPRFKNQWLVCVTQTQRNDILEAFKEVVAKEINSKMLVEAQQQPERNNRENDFFNFESDFESENSKMNVQRSLDAPYRKAEAQVLQFFAEESTDLSILYSYPEIKRVFLKYNTPLPSLMTGERLFHLQTMNELKLNYKAFNELLEKRLILNAQMNSKQLF